MDLDLSQLRALSAAVAEGSLDAAARRLHITPSAVSQRLKALEGAAGRVLLVRSKPVRVTDAGAAVLRLARQIELLAQETEDELVGAAALPGPSEDGQAPAMPVVSVAVNADSLATWLLPALAPLGGDMALDLHREDQEHTKELLRDGRVMAAVTAETRPVPGCSVSRLGVMRYRMMAAPGYARRWFDDGPTVTALARAPVVVFNRQDDLQHRYLRRRSRHVLAPPVHHVPSSVEFLAAVRLGLGWGMVPELQLEPGDRGADGLVDLDPARAMDVTLYWQQWKLRSATLDRVAQAVLAAAREQLIRAAPR